MTYFSKTQPPKLWSPFLFPRRNLTGRPPKRDNNGYLWNRWMAIGQPVSSTFCNAAQYSGKGTDSIDETLISKENSDSSIIPQEWREIRNENCKLTSCLWHEVYIFTVTENVQQSQLFSRWLPLSIVERFSEDRTWQNESHLSGRERATLSSMDKRRNTESWLLPGEDNGGRQ